MIFFRSKKNREYLNLIKAIQIVSKEGIGEDARMRMKQTIMLELSREQNLAGEGYYSSWMRLIEKLKTGGSALRLPDYLKAKIKNSLFIKWEELSSKSKTKWEVFFDLFIGRKKAWASLLIVSLFLTILLPIFVNNPVIYAEGKTYLEIKSGEVTVLRAREKLKTSSSLILEEGDKIITGKKAEAVIIFFDGSISRISEETEVNIDRLFVDLNLTQHHIVSLDLIKGRLWSKIISTFGNLGQFNVTARDIMVTASEKAAFDIKTNDIKTDILAVSEMVDLHLYQTEEKVLKKTLIAGYKMEVTKNDQKKSITIGQEESILKIKISKESNPAVSDRWTSGNIIKDKQYETDLAEKNKELVKIEAGVLLPDNIFYPVKSVIKQAQISLTFDQLAKEKQMLTDVFKKITEAAVLIIKGKEKIAGDTLAKFKSDFDLFISMLNDLSKNNPEDANALRAEMRKSFISLGEMFSSAPPDDNLYQIKYLLEKLKINVESNNDQILQLKIENISRKINDLSLLAENKANSLFILRTFDNDYQDWKNIGQEIKNYSDTERKEIFLNLLLKQVIKSIGTLKIYKAKIADENLFRKIEQTQRRLLIITEQCLVDTVNGNDKWNNQMNKKILTSAYSTAKLLELLAVFKKQLGSTNLIQKAEELEAMFQEEKLVSTTEIRQDVALQEVPALFVVVPVTPDVQSYDLKID